MQRTLKKEILDKLKEGDVSLAKLSPLRRHRSNITYDLRQCMKKKEVRAYLKFNPDSKTKGGFDNELFFHYTKNYSEFEDVGDLVDEMLGKEDPITARHTFKDLYMDRGMKTEHFKREIMKKAFKYDTVFDPDMIHIETDEKTKEKREIKGTWIAPELTEEQIAETKLVQSKEDIERAAERLTYLLLVRTPRLRESVAYCLTYRMKNKDGSYAEVYPLYDRAIGLKITSGLGLISSNLLG